ncbi:metal ABC transporter ATP-binding protein [Seleniivibrio woodruffii]|uniref:Zinc transport system ATP-binding protein n=1 Tax=Seleniivibrio woodruffii TaxID=1078050 RepID=A0A4R1KCT0_9BACT|nr:metal ABC transporter ATP-binding protein [Seleniivibrio woodruffii]TCK61783.1 zinc transport system ATP-binding protein [Seleniivibrio woodruffii]TVZ35102.1 zinc transport system ATP-binding protein [Seleniivibrio woodruffii]
MPSFLSGGIMSETENAVSVRNLNFSYGATEVLRNISFDIKKREFLAVIGPNGGGKSTLLKLLLGILKPDSGEINILGHKPGTVKKIGYVPQNVTSGGGFPVTVEDVALMGRMLTRGGFTKQSDRDYVRMVLEQLQITDIAKKRMDDLSGGQRQRVLMARALAGEPELIFLDEPASNVDMEGQTRIYDILAKLNEKITVVVVSHDLTIIPKFATSVACVSTTLHKHDEAEVTPDMMHMSYGADAHCPVELVAHGHPHRVLKEHK